MRPPFTYYGGKFRLAPLIVSMLPPHRAYVEPFFGCGAVLFNKRPSVHEIVNDLDHNVITFFRVLRERPDELELACRLTPYARAEFELAEFDDALDDLERARRFWVRVNQSFAKTASRQTGFSVTTARTVSTAASAWSRIGRFAAVAERLQRVVFERCDAAALIERMATTADTAVYVDPPYLAETRRSRDRHNPGDYRCDMGSTADHERLAEALKATPAAVVLSSYPSPLYDRLYADWWRLDVPVKVHSSNATRSTRGERTEVLWSNRPVNLGQLPFTAPPGGDSQQETALREADSYARRKAAL